MHGGRSNGIVRTGVMQAVDGKLSDGKLSAWGLLAIAYAYVCGGAYGIEQAVGAAGAAGVVAALAAFGLAWALPQALVTAELSTAFPLSGSSIFWIREGLGPRWAFVNAIVLSLGLIFDLAVYPGLITSYAAALLPALAEPGTAFGVQAACILLVGGANALGVSILAVVTALMMLITVTPFFVFPVAAAALHQPFDFSAASVIPPMTGAGIGVFISTILWTFQGFSNVGSLAAEVRDPRRAFPAVMAAVVALAVISYAVPVGFGVALHPNLDDWSEGFFSTLLGDVAPWLGGFVAVGSTVANLASGLSATSLYARFIAAAAREAYIPVPLLGRLQGPRADNPVPAILFLTLTTLALTSVSFAALLVFDTLFNLLSIVLVFASFLSLRLRRPELERPYAIPGGMCVALLVVLPPAVLACAAVVLIALGGWVPVLGVLGVTGGLYALAVARELTDGFFGRWPLSPSDTGGGSRSGPDSVKLLQLDDGEPDAFLS
jgi:amino acid transporter